MRIDMIHRRVRCTGFVKLYAALSIGSVDSLALAGGRSHDANPNNHAFVHGINIHGNQKSLKSNCMHSSREKFAAKIRIIISSTILVRVIFLIELF